MSRYRLMPTPAQEVVLREHCAHARFVWNLAVEQQSWWRPGRGSAPGRRERQRQLTEARAEFEWLRAGSSNVQQCALLDYTHAMADFFGGVHGKPSWRKEGRRDGFRIVGPNAYVKASPGRWEKPRVWAVRRLSRHVGEVLIPKLGWVRFRWSRPVPDAKSFRVTLDRAARWHVAFAAWPAPTVPGPGTGEIVGIDRGITVSAALSTGEMLRVPQLCVTGGSIPCHGGRGDDQAGGLRRGNGVPRRPPVASRRPTR